MSLIRLSEGVEGSYYLMVPLEDHEGIVQSWEAREVSERRLAQLHGMIEKEGIVDT